MDPDATWAELLQAYRAKDGTACRQACRDLTDWLKKGGFPPRVVDIKALDRLIVHTVCAAYLVSCEAAAPLPLGGTDDDA